MVSVVPGPKMRRHGAEYPHEGCSDGRRKVQKPRVRGDEYIAPLDQRGYTPKGEPAGVNYVPPADKCARVPVKHDTCEPRLSDKPGEGLYVPPRPASMGKVAPEHNSNQMCIVRDAVPLTKPYVNPAARLGSDDTIGNRILKLDAQPMGEQLNPVRAPGQRVSLHVRRQVRHAIEAFRHELIKRRYTVQILKPVEKLTVGLRHKEVQPQIRRGIPQRPQGRRNHNAVAQAGVSTHRQHTTSVPLISVKKGLSSTWERPRDELLLTHRHTP